MDTSPADDFCFTYTYFDGVESHTVHLDPQETHRSLIREAGGALGRILKDARSDDIQTAFPAIEELLRVARVVFQLPVVDRATGKGVLERDVHRVLGEFWEYLSGVKKKTRQLSDLAATYGVGVLGRQPTREELFGLWLHTDRIRLQRATEVSLGISAAFRSGPLERSWFDATARDEAEVDELQATVNAERLEAAILAKYGMRRD